MLAEAVEGLVRAVDIHEGFGAVGIFAVDFCRSQLAVGFLDKRFAVAVLVGDAAVDPGNHKLEPRGCDGDVVAGGLHRPLGARPLGLGDDVVFEAFGNDEVGE